MWDTMRAVVTRDVIGLVGRRYRGFSCRQRHAHKRAALPDQRRAIAGREASVHFSVLVVAQNVRRDPLRLAGLRGPRHGLDAANGELPMACDSNVLLADVVPGQQHTARARLQLGAPVATALCRALRVPVADAGDFVGLVLKARREGSIIEQRERTVRLELVLVVYPPDRALVRAGTCSRTCSRLRSPDELAALHVELRLCEHDAARRLIWRDAARPLLTRGHDAWRAMLGHNESCREVKASA